MVLANPYARYLPVLGMVTMSTVAAGAVIFLIIVLNDKPPTPVRVQQISLMPLQPPPPLERPPEPEIKKELPMEAPQDAVTDANDPVATENTTGNGPTIKHGNPSAGIGTPFGNYSADLTADLRDWILQDKRMRGENYNVTLRLWIGRNGRVERVELASTTGKPVLDQRLRTTLASFIGRVREPPPQEMPQPVRLSVRGKL